MRPFGFPIIILNTLDPLGKFQGKVDEGFLVGYSVCSKAFRDNKDAHTGGNKHNDDIQKFVSPDIHSSSCGDQAREKGDKAMNKDKGKNPIVTITGFRDLNEEFAKCINNSSNGVSATGPLVSAAGLDFINSTNDFTAAEADTNNMESIISVSPILTARIHKDHPTSQIISDLSSTTQTRSMARRVRDQGFEHLKHPDKVYKVVKALYGLHEAPRAWYETLATYLLKNGFQRGKIDQTLFVKKQQKDILLVHIYVDDIIFGATNKALC
nr:putative ribonuclease H-like domain-containing protein [Tanacetum cinerariifolium]